MTQYALGLQKMLNYFKIPKSEYSFSGGMADNCMCVEKKDDTWESYYSSSGERIVRGIFFREYAAYDFLFYLVMKKHVSIKKRWW